MQLSEFQDQSDQILYQAIRSCRLGRDVLLSYYGNLAHVEAKEQAGLVSEADRESESVIQKSLAQSYPHVQFLGEETAYLQRVKSLAPLTQGARWILDPLDGTTNYIHRFPIFCISLALEIDQEVQLAVIDVPVLNETYTAIKGRGAFLNGRKISISQSKNLSEAFLATGFVAEHENVITEQLSIFSDLVRQCRGVRRPGAAAYDLCLVAQGVFDGFWERNLQPWDSAAGALLVREAGGIVETYRGQSYHPFLNSCVAGSPGLVKEMQAIFQPHLRPETH